MIYLCSTNMSFHLYLSVTKVSKEDIGTSTSKAIDATDFLAKEISLDSTAAVEALLSAAANRPVSGSTTWSTPLPQSSADGAVHLVGAEVESMATTDCLEQALIKPRRVKRWQPRLSTAKTRARFERLAQKLGSLWAAETSCFHCLWKMPGINGYILNKKDNASRGLLWEPYAPRQMSTNSDLQSCCRWWFVFFQCDVFNMSPTLVNWFWGPVTFKIILAISFPKNG